MLEFNGGKLLYSKTTKTPVKPRINVKDTSNLRYKLRAYRIHNRLSKRAMSKLLGVTPVTYGLWENKGQRPDIIYRQRIVRLLKKEGRWDLVGKKSSTPIHLPPKEILDTISNSLITNESSDNG